MNENCWYKEVCTRPTCDACIRFIEMSYLMDNSGIPKKRQMPTLLNAGDDRQAFIHLADIKDNIQSFVEDGENLYICSDNTGNGKTSWAIKLMLKYFDCIWAGNGLRIRGYFLHVPSFLALTKDFDSKELVRVKKIISDTDLIIWDDIASSKLSDFDINQLLIFIDNRKLHQLSNIYTGNITAYSNLVECVGNRLASRIWQSDKVTFYGKDRR